MPCRVGISTNPEKRRQDWEGRVVGLRKWRILNTFRSFRYAQDYEIRMANKYGCKAAPEGASGARGPWYVYYFEYTRKGR